jgi:membrane-associated protein
VHLLASILNPNDIISKGGLFLVAAIIFSESCLLFFLPGDSLLFITGFLATKPKGLPHINQPVIVAALVLIAVAILGNQVAYLTGKSIGPRLFSRPDSKLFKPSNLAKAHDFFERNGSKTIILARFVPVVRTFAPIVAGMSRMKYRLFVTYNVIGAAIWAGGLTILGYFLGKQQFVKDHIELAAVGIVILSMVPVLIEYRRHRRQLTNGSPSSAA